MTRKQTRPSFKPALRQHPRRHLSLLTFCIFAIVASRQSRGATYYVNASQTNHIATGASWTNAYPKVQPALNLATNGDSIWVARGTYSENLTLSNGISLYGGFAGDETTLLQRSWFTNLTVLDGRQLGSVITVTLNSTNPATRIDGFRIQNGRAALGAGIYCSGSALTIANNQIVWNTATNATGGSSRGSGIYFTGGSPVIASNLIQDNLTAGPFSSGGGISWFGGSPVILNNRVIANVVSGGATYGSGISGVGAGSPKVIGNVVSANRSKSANCSGIHLQGVTAGEIINNTATRNDKAGIFCDSASVTIGNNVIAYNQTGMAGVTGLNYRNNCTFGNQSDFFGFPDPTGQNGNISVDPLLSANPHYPEFHLVDGSPCIDAGDSTLIDAWPLDTDGDPRAICSGVDIGADEFTGAPPALLTTPIHVSPSGSDTNSGLTWSTAKRGIQAALNEASLGGGEVWVRAGIYTNNLNLRPFAYLYGGFGGNETNRSERNWQTNVSILDGGKIGRVLTGHSLVKSSTVDGFIIRHGAATLGAGIYLDDSSIPIINNTITNNHASNSGGGIYSRLGSATISQNTIRLNSANHGGGIYWHPDNTPAIISKNRFESNWAKISASPQPFTASGGGALYVENVSGGSPTGAPLISENFFTANAATNAQGGAICANSPRLVVVNNTFTANRAAYGGGLHLLYSPDIMANNLVAFNSSGISSQFPLGNTTSAQFKNNCVYGNDTNFTSASPTGLNENISVDPLMLAVSDYHLGASSPCINAGDSNFVFSVTDLAGAARIAGGSVDIGAHELPNPSSVISYAWLQNFGMPTDGSFDFVDSDGDGLNNYVEWRFQSDPTNFLSTPAPVVTLSPQSSSQVVGLPAKLTAQISGATPFTVQWRLNGTNLESATGSVLIITNFQPPNVGDYSVAVTNTFGWAISSNASIELGEVAAWGQISPVPAGATNLIAIACGDNHALLLQKNGTMSAWKFSFTNDSAATSIPDELSNIAAIAAGFDCSAALLESGGISLWGRQDQSAMPFTPTNLVSVSLGNISTAKHTIALHSDGTVSAWGQGDYNETLIPGNLEPVVAIAAGANGNIALHDNGRATSWGNYSSEYSNITNIVAIAAGFSFAVALKSDGTVAVGWGNESVVTNLPPGLTNIIAIAAGGRHCLALRADGTVIAWGSNESNQTDVPPGLTNVIAISAGAATSMALVHGHGPVLQAPLLNPAFSNGVFRAQIQTESGRVYRLEYQNTPSSSEWLPLPLVAGNGQIKTLSDTNSTTPNRIYRVRRW